MKRVFKKVWEEIKAPVAIGLLGIVFGVGFGIGVGLFIKVTVG